MKSRFWRNVLVVSALASCWGLLSCDKPPAMVPCNMILPTALTSVPFLDARDAGRATDWIRANWGADALSVNSPGPSYSWHDSGHRYSAHFGPTNQWINVAYSEPPSIAAIIGCFGSPSGYSIIERPAEIIGKEIGLFYPERGAVFTYIAYGAKWPGAFDANSRMQELDLVRGGSMSEMTSRLIPDGYREAVLRNMKPWPSPFERIP